MPRIIVLSHDELCPHGAQIEASSGTSLCNALLENDVEIEHACEKCGACTTCHVWVREGSDSLTPPDELEEDMLDKAWGVSLESRLSCQALLGDRDIVIEIPPYTVNHAKEKSS